MGFKDSMVKLRKAMLCGGGEGSRHSLQIVGGSVNALEAKLLIVCVDEGATDGLSDFPFPGISSTLLLNPTNFYPRKALIREKASSDAHLISLSSFPPLDAANHHHSPSATSSPAHSFPASLVSSRCPSTTLLNSASSNLPTSLPTPPRREFSDSILPVRMPASAHASSGIGAGAGTGNRMKGLWERTRRLSSSLGGSTHGHNHGHGDAAGHEGRKGGKGGTAASDEEGVVLLNLDLAFKENGLDSERASAKSVEGFEVQDCVGGAREAAVAVSAKGNVRELEVAVKGYGKENGGIKEVPSPIEDPFASRSSLAGGRASSSDEDDCVAGAGQVIVGERVPLVASH
ncbi:uncharacterized protein EI97DRAFT_456436 [Westerdykella ornata]|uniref:Uncharacterized protein n=1 Tax=Westerdykella ornata TaxID=318751 RepID=A0A6A6JQX7_WESOR|nr:uncharacterized protein EI97DRAFT_456436 [Westerdykella ornata]KAF2279031.1 hypothetical protein EI97DRAFT_456436 [Westerdykella ornata]